jgi:hypothetical protein
MPMNLIQCSLKAKCLIVLGTLIPLFAPCRAHSAAIPQDIIWGAQTNGVSAGLFNDGGQLAGKQATIEVWLTNHTTAGLAFVVPAIPLAFNIAVFDQNGKPVRRTPRGQDTGQRFSKTTQISEKEYPKLKRTVQGPHELTLLREDKLNLFDYFAIDKPGKYRVEYEQRLQIPTGRYTLAGIVCPLVVTSLEIK